MSPDLFAAAGLIGILAAAALWLSLHKPKPIAFLLLASGIAWGIFFLTDPGAQKIGADIRSWNFLGVNVMLTAWAWSLLVAWFEVFQRGYSESGGGHAHRTPAVALLAGFGLFSWSLAGLRLAGLGVILLGAALILIWKQQWPEVAAVLALLGAAGVASGTTFLLGLGRWTIAGIPDAWYAAVFTGGLGICMLYRRRHGDDDQPERQEHGHLKTPAIIAVFGMCLMLAGGQVFTGWISHQEKSGVQTAAKVTPAGQVPGPQGPLTGTGYKIGEGILGALGGHR
jgi:hypothetical protein